MRECVHAERQRERERESYQEALPSKVTAGIICIIPIILLGFLSNHDEEKKEYKNQFISASKNRFYPVFTRIREEYLYLSICANISCYYCIYQIHKCFNYQIFFKLFLLKVFIYDIIYNAISNTNEYRFQQPLTLNIKCTLLEKPYQWHQLLLKCLDLCSFLSYR